MTAATYTTIRAASIWEHKRSATRLMVVHPPDRTFDSAGRLHDSNDLTLVEARGWQAEMSRSALLRDYVPVSLPPSEDTGRLSSRAQQVLRTIGMCVVDLCTIGAPPPTQTTIANLSGVGHGQIGRTLRHLARQGLLHEWLGEQQDGGEPQYVPTVAGRLLLGDTLPTAEQIRERRHAATRAYRLCNN